MKVISSKQNTYSERNPVNEKRKTQNSTCDSRTIILVMWDQEACVLDDTQTATGHQSLGAVASNLVQLCAGIKNLTF